MAFGFGGVHKIGLLGLRRAWNRAFGLGGVHEIGLLGLGVYMK